jgi:RNA polymerase sigma-70 factor (sigma-E family)
MRASDEAEFAEFVTTVSGRLLRSTYAVCRDRQLAEDAVQSALTAACMSWRKVRAADNPEAYVRRMAFHQVLGWRRRKAWQAEVTRAELPDLPVVSHEDGVLDHRLVWDALGQLPPRQRAVVVLRYFEDLSEQDIATTLGVRPGTVKSQSSAALAHLRAVLADLETVVPERS